MRKPVNVNLPAELIARMDRFAPKGRRSQFVERLIRREVERREKEGK
jgi:metal-responsive CopG/Arc/MetJ family transcriptional regulator